MPLYQQLYLNSFSISRGKMAENQHFTEWFMLSIVLCAWYILSHSFITVPHEEDIHFFLTREIVHLLMEARNYLYLCYISDVCVCESINWRILCGQGVKNTFQLETGPAWLCFRFMSRAVAYSSAGCWLHESLWSGNKWGCNLTRSPLAELCTLV